METQTESSQTSKNPRYHLRRIRGWTYVYEGETRITPKGSSWDAAEAICKHLNSKEEAK